MDITAIDSFITMMGSGYVSFHKTTNSTVCLAQAYLFDEHEGAIIIGWESIELQKSHGFVWPNGFKNKSINWYTYSPKRGGIHFSVFIRRLRSLFIVLIKTVKTGRALKIRFNGLKYKSYFGVLKTNGSIKLKKLYLM